MELNSGTVLCVCVRVHALKFMESGYTGLGVCVCVCVPTQEKELHVSYSLCSIQSHEIASGSSGCPRSNYWPAVLLSPFAQQCSQNIEDSTGSVYTKTEKLLERQREATWT